MTTLMAEGRRMMRRAEELGPDRFEALLREYARVLREALQRAGGRNVWIEGDTATAVFASATDAVLAAAAAQRAVEAHAWGVEPRVAISIGLDEFLRGCADLCDAAEGGQTFVAPAILTWM